VFLGCAGLALCGLFLPARSAEEEQASMKLSRDV
jgi:hypothetical protein